MNDHLLELDKKYKVKEYKLNEKYAFLQQDFDNKLKNKLSREQYLIDVISDSSCKKYKYKDYVEMNDTELDGMVSEYLAKDSNILEYDHQMSLDYQEFMDSSDQNKILVLDFYGGRKGSTVTDNILGDNYQGPHYLSKLPPNKCGAENCYATNNRIFEKTADAIILDHTWIMKMMQHKNHWFRYFDFPDMRKAYRNYNQYWIAYSRESAAKANNDTNIWEANFDKYGNSIDSSFNLTASYRRDSDIYLPWNTVDNILDLIWKNDNGVIGREVENKMTDQKFLQEKILAPKYKEKNRAFVTWFVSNCNSTIGARKRLDVAKQLMDYGVKMDIYGACYSTEKIDYQENLPILCGKRHTSTRTNNPSTDTSFSNKRDPSTSISKIRSTSSKYKFYLAFENGIHCNDYISEKFWKNSLSTNLVPIVYGPAKEDVAAVAPKNSFIHVEDYQGNLNKLADYLIYLNNNDTAYLEYHFWRLQKPSKNLEPTLSREDHQEHPVLNGKSMSMICKTCRELNRLINIEKRPKIMKRSIINYWWLNLHDDQCLGDSPDKFKWLLREPGFGVLN